MKMTQAFCTAGIKLDQINGKVLIPLEVDIKRK